MFRLDKKGFTLIELLIVVAIIGILAAVVLASLNQARSKARDSERVSNIQQIQTALELYYSTNGKYPASWECGATTPSASWSNSVECLSNGHWLRDSASDLSPFFSADPVDPAQENNWPHGAYYYFSENHGGEQQWYMLVYALENPNPSLENIDGVTAPDGTYFHYGDGTDGVITVGVEK